MLWPGVPFVLLQPKHGKGRVRAGQQGWLTEATMSTSAVVAYMTFCTSHGNRKIKDRAHSCTAFKLLLERLVSVRGCLSLTWQHLATARAGRGPWMRVEGAWQTLRVGTDLALDVAQLCSPEILTLDLKGGDITTQWHHDRGMAGKTWVQGEIGSPKLREWICFCRDPQHPQSLKDLLQPGGLSLLSQLAYVLDESIQDLGPAAGMQMSMSKRQPAAVQLESKRQIAERLWNGEDQHFFH